jgi:glycosyltransferase involved in cell wall biosynthesis
MNNAHSKWILHAPNLHTGGGLTLLQSLIETLPNNVRLVQCDARAKQKLVLPPDLRTTYVLPSIWSRLQAEWRLHTTTTHKDVILCMNNLPPLFSCKGTAIVFLHSRLLASDIPLVGYSLWTRLRIKIERIWLRALRDHASRYLVQTPSMAAALKQFLGKDIPIEICMFTLEIEKSSQTAQPIYDYIYPATGDVHKNHVTLLRAWQELARSSFRPSLVLTVDPQRYPSLAREIERLQHTDGLNIVNLGVLPHDKMGHYYQSARALIFPSQLESLGLPLLEAKAYGLPILAVERDYVRDIVTPAETFDPDSALSIARAVLRHEDKPMPVTTAKSAREFWNFISLPQ